jgi:hypothetical protein
MSADSAGVGISVEPDDITLHDRGKASGGGFFAVGFEPHIDLFYRRVDDGVAHSQLRPEQLHKPISALDKGHAVVECPRRR